jgi:hypothetical protein
VYSNPKEWAPTEKGDREPPPLAPLPPGIVSLFQGAFAIIQEHGATPPNMKMIEGPVTVETKRPRANSANSDDSVPAIKLAPTTPPVASAPPKVKNDNPQCEAFRATALGRCHEHGRRG